MTLHIDIEPSATGKCWLATFSGTDRTGVPTGVPIPLPFHYSATFKQVTDHLTAKFPRAVVATSHSPYGWQFAGGPTDQPSPLQRHAERRLAEDIDLELDVW